MSNKKLGNLKILRDDMKKKGWVIDSFLFSYKESDYIVLVKLYLEEEKKPDYALTKLEFRRRGKITDKLICPANSNGLMIDYRTIREYFNVKYSDNRQDFFDYLYTRLGNDIPDKVIETKTDEQSKAMVYSLSKSDSENPKKVYCYMVRRSRCKNNGDPGQRSVFNDNKTRILRRDLYNMFKEDKGISFCYDEDQDAEKDDEEILLNWKKNNNLHY